MSITPPTGILDITDAIVRVSKLEFRGATGFDTILNNVARNTVLLVDQNVEYTTDTPWGLKLPNAWVSEFDAYWASGASGNITFNVYNNTTSGTNGYTIAMDDTTITIAYDGGSALKTVTLGSTLKNDTWRKIHILFERDMLSLAIDGVPVLYFKDTLLRPRVYDEESGYVIASGLGANRKFKNLRILNGDKWMTDTTSNIAYVHGNVGIGTTQAAYTLDVVGDIRATGNLLIEGLTTTVDTQNLSIEDAIVEIGRGNDGGTSGKDVGFLFTRNDGTNTTNSNVALIYDESTDRLTLGYSDGSPTDSTLAVNTSKSLDVVIPSGNLGIGTASPDNKLEIADHASRNPTLLKLTCQTPLGGTGSESNTAIQLLGTDGTTYGGYIEGYLSQNVGSGLKLGQIGGSGEKIEHMRITGGNVGIGTNNPRNILEVRGGDGTASDTYATFGKVVQGSAGWSGIRLGTPYTSAHDAYCSVIESYNDHNSNYNSELRFKTSSGDNAEAGERMRITSQGNVGIGTYPGAKLDIFASSTDPGAVPTVHIGDASVDYGDYGMLQLTRHATTGGSKAHAAFIRNGNTVFGMGYHNNTNTFGFWPSFSTVTNTPTMAFQTDGNVGIGTASPGAKMDIYTGSTAIVGLSFDRFASGNYRTDIYQNTYGPDFRVGYAEYTPESVLYLKRFSNGSKEVEINGNVGIGTASPRRALDVYGELIVAKADNIGVITTGAVQTNPTTRLSNYVIGNTTTVNNAGSPPVFATNLAITPNAIYGGVLWATEGYGEPTLHGGDLVLYGGDINASGNNGTGAGQYYAGHTYIQGGIAFTGNNIGDSGRTYNGSIYFQTGVDDTTSSTDTERYIRMSIKPGGNVGIGTVSPGAKLHITAGLTTDDTWVDVLKVNADDNWNFRLAQYHDLGNFISYGFKQRYNTVEYDVLTFKEGNVGIGTVSPSDSLHVMGAISTQNGGNPAVTPQVLFRSGPSNTNSWMMRANVSDAYAGDFTIDRLDASVTPTKFVIQNGGNVGIGTNNPAYKLHIRSSTAAALLVESDNGGTGYPVNIDFRNYDSQVPPGARISVTDDTDYGSDIRFLTKTGSGGTGALSERMIIQGDGNVGIGKTNPNIPLDVGNALENPRIGRDLIFGTVHDADKRDSIYFGRRDGTSVDFLGMKCRVDTHTALGYGDYSNQTKIEFHTWGNSYAGSREVMCIRGDGNVGIGTASPTHPLHIKNGDASYIRTGPNTTYNSSLYLGASGGGAWASNECGVITTNGNIHLDAGTSRDIYLNFFSGNDVQFGSGGGVVHSSDDRLKTQEELIENATQTLMKLKPQKYLKAIRLPEDNDVREPRTEAGLIAQDVWYDAPELRFIVKPGDNANPSEEKPPEPVTGDIQQDPDYSDWGTTPAGLSYTCLIPYLIKSNQELYTEIQAEKAKVATLETQLASVLARLDALESA